MERPWVMGILNLTPDSFHDGGRYLTEKQAFDRMGTMLSEGADIIDMGAYSSRPGAERISQEEESDRLLPTLRSCRKEFPGAVISIDTFRSEVAKAALDEGADIINDISGGELDARMASEVASHRVPFICMHMRGTPQSTHQHLTEGPILAEVLRYFFDKVSGLKEAGIHDIILDPGFGFGKTLEQNYELAQHLGELGILGHPLLVGISRKSMVNRLLGTTPETALNGTTALHALLLERGADILRVHDVAEARQAVDIHMAMHPQRDLHRAPIE